MQSRIRSWFNLLPARGQKAFAVLLDPDKTELRTLPDLVAGVESAGASLWLVGGSHTRGEEIQALVPALKTLSRLPVVLFPGSVYQLTPEADAILFLSLISGRNPEYLIGQQVLAAPMVRESGLEVLPTGYMLVDGGKMTTVNYISHTLPLPADKPDLAVSTALAGEMLGLGVLYLDCGSGAARSLPTEIVKSVRQAVNLPLIAGGGIRKVETAQELWQAGADLLVIGTAGEQHNGLAFLHELGKSLEQQSPVSIDTLTTS